MECISLCVVIVLFVLFLPVMCAVSALIYKCLKSATLDLQPDLSKLNRPSQAKPVAAEALRSVPSHMTKGGCGSVYFWEEARMDSYAAAPMTSYPLKYVQTSKY